MKDRATVALSGGMDSATVLAFLARTGYEVLPVSFHYGSKHNEHERRAAEEFCLHYGLRLEKIDLSSVMGSFQSALLKSSGDPIPEGHYTDSSMSQTVVPGRNIIFLSILAGYAWTNGASVIGIGIHQGDHAIYPDCRPNFFNAMNDAIQYGTDERVRIVAPFLLTDKEGILRWGLQNGLPYEKTRTCYKDQPISCGRCGSCVERLEAFKRMGVVDPIPYEGGVG